MTPEAWIGEGEEEPGPGRPHPVSDPTQPPLGQHCPLSRPQGRGGRGWGWGGSDRWGLPSIVDALLLHHG